VAFPAPIALAVLVLLPIQEPPPPQAPPAPRATPKPTVREVVFEGKTRLSEELLRLQIRTRAGTEYSQETIDQDIKDLAAFIIQQNKTAPGGHLSPAELARSTVAWTTIGILGMLLITWVLARYNMRWIARRAAARRAAEGRDAARP